MQEFPEIIHAVRLYRYGSRLLKYGDKRLSGGRGFLFVDGAFLEVFTFPLVKGNPQTALNEPFSIVLTETASQRAFGDEDPVGKTIRYDNKFEFKVRNTINKGRDQRDSTLTWKTLTRNSHNHLLSPTALQ